MEESGGPPKHQTTQVQNLLGTLRYGRTAAYITRTEIANFVGSRLQVTSSAEIWAVLATLKKKFGGKLQANFQVLVSC